MNTVTNSFLSEILQIHKKSKIFLRRLEAPELVEIDERMYKAAQSSYTNLLFNNKYLDELWDEAIDPTKNGLVTELALQIYFIKRFLDLKPEILKQLMQCKKFLVSDICKRNVEFVSHLENEIKILEAVLLFRPTNYLVNLINLISKEILPEEKIYERYVRISEIMHSLKIYDKKPYLTLDLVMCDILKKEKIKEEFYLEALNEYKTQGKIQIYDRIKKDINEKLILKY